jgi:hypothetical protein
MRCLRLVMLLLIAIFGLGTTALAFPCCPKDCVYTNEQLGYCVHNGTLNYCGPAFTCPNPPPPPPSHDNPRAGGGTAPGGFSPIGCLGMFDPNFCVDQLANNRTRQLCLNESYADKAEDNRTGLACWQRQAKMASQCTARCQQFTALLGNNCSRAQSVWLQVFGPIGAGPYGFAEIENCGPRLPSRPGIIQQR